MKKDLLFAPALCALLSLLVACGGDSSSSDDEPEALAQPDAERTLENLGFQSNSRDLLEMDTLTPEAVRGFAPEVIRGSVPDFIRGKRSVASALESPFSGVDCAWYELDESQPGWLIHRFLFDDGCEVEGTIFSGAFALLQSDPPEAGGFSIEYDQLTVNGDSWDGVVGLEAPDQEGSGFLIDVFFEEFTSPTKGYIDGTCKVASDRGYYYGYNWEFTGFSLDGGVWDGDYDYDPGANGTAELTLRLSDGNIDGTYEYEEASLEGDRWSYVGSGSYRESGSGRQVEVAFDFILDPAACGSDPAEGWMTLEASGETSRFEFDCGAITQE